MTSWTYPQIARARAMWDEGASRVVIAAALDVTINAVNGVAYRYNFRKRPKGSPVSDFAATLAPLVTMMTVRQISRHLGVSKNIVEHRLRRCGLKAVTGQKGRPAQSAETLAIMARTMTVGEIAEALGRTRSSVWLRLHKHGIAAQPAKRGRPVFRACHHAAAEACA